MIVQVYAPTSTSPEDEIEKFYDDLDAAYRMCGSQEMKIVNYGPRGAHYLSVRSDEKVACVNWMDNKSVLFMSSAHAVEPSDECRRWSKKENQHIQVKRPFVVNVYNDKMGGVECATGCCHTIE